MTTSSSDEHSTRVPLPDHGRGRPTPVTADRARTGFGQVMGLFALILGLSGIGCVHRPRAAVAASRPSTNPSSTSASKPATRYKKIPFVR